MIEFVSPEETSPGCVLSMLEEAYAPFRAVDGETFEVWRKDWREFDGFVYGDAPFAGNWMFFSRVDGELAGFVSWDPRQRPVALLGHNCVIPHFQGRGCGIAQIRRALDVLRGQGFERVLVQTGRDDFFAPARAMYERAGFTALRNLELVEPRVCSVVEYELAL